MPDWFYEYCWTPIREPKILLFTWEHLMLTGLVLLIGYGILYYVFSYKSRLWNKKLLFVLACVMIALEVFRIVWLTFMYHDYDFISFLKNVRFDWCNQICLVMPVLVLLKKEKTYDYLSPLAIIGGLGVLIYPVFVFYDYGGMHLLAVQSMISHGLMVLIGFLMPLSSDYNPDIKKLWKPSAAVLGMAVVACIMSHVLNVNYMLMLRADGIPLLSSIPNPWYFFILVPVVAGIIALVVYVMQKITEKIKPSFTDAEVLSQEAADALKTSGIKSE